MRARAATAAEAKGAPALPRSSGLRRSPSFRTRTLSRAAFPFKIPKISRSGSKRTPEARRCEAPSGERRTCSISSGGTIPRSAPEPGVRRTPGRSSRSSWPPTDARCRKAASTPAMQPPFRCRAAEPKPDDSRLALIGRVTTARSAARVEGETTAKVRDTGLPSSRATPAGPNAASGRSSAPARAPRAAPARAAPP